MKNDNFNVKVLPKGIWFFDIENVISKKDNIRTYLRWQAYISLAFGAKKLQFSDVYLPQYIDSKTNFQAVENSSEYYAVNEYLKELNYDIEKICKILDSCKYQGVIFSLKEGIFKDSKLFKNILSDFEPVISIEGKDAVMGCFIDKDKTKKILVTNINYESDTKTVININDNVEMVNVYIGTSRFSLSPKNGKLNININPGDAVFIEF